MPCSNTTGLPSLGCCGGGSKVGQFIMETVRYPAISSGPDLGNIDNYAAVVAELEGYAAALVAAANAVTLLDHAVGEYYRWTYPEGDFTPVTPTLETNFNLIRFGASGATAMMSGGIIEWSAGVGFYDATLVCERRNGVIAVSCDFTRTFISAPSFPTVRTYVDEICTAISAQTLALDSPDFDDLIADTTTACGITTQAGGIGGRLRFICTEPEGGATCDLDDFVDDVYGPIDLTCCGF